MASIIPFPPTIDFSLIKPKGYSAQIINREFTPAPFNANIAQQDLIRFLINQHRGFWDPYSAYVDVDVDFSSMSNVGALQLDGSAHSLISRLQIYVNGTSMELIDEYDSLLHFLHDMQMGRENKKLKQSEGVGNDQGGQSDGSQSFQDNGSVTYTNITNWNGAQFYNINQKPNHWLMNTNYALNNNFSTLIDTSGALAQTGTNATIAGSLLSQTEPIAWNSMTGYQTFLTLPGNNIATQEIPLRRYEEQYFRNNSTFSPANLTAYYTQQAPGFACSNLFASNFCNQNFEQVFSKNYTRYHVKDGNMGALSAIPTASFQFPLASSFLGTLLPSDSYKYIPFSALPDLVIEFTLSKYAFFTSGYIEDEDDLPLSAQVTFANLGCRKAPVTQQQRIWSIQKFNLNVSIIIFDDQAIEDMVNAQLITNGILLHSCGWTLALKQVFGTSASCAGNFAINYGFESLKAIFVMYELNDYQQYSFCRKHFRCSRNVTSLQLRIGDRIYPQTPITGSGGNALKYSSVTKTNQQFVQELYKAFNKQFTINSEAAINMANFAPNKRSYNVACPLSAFFSGTNPGTQWSYNYTTHTNMGQTLMYENQLRGMAAYCVCLDVMGNDNNVMGGVDTKQNVPFNVLLTTDVTGTAGWANDGTANYDLQAEREVTGQFWCYYDYLILFKAGQTPQKIGAQ